jgi:hypothetical protein
MNMLENIVLVAIVAAAIFFLARALIRSLSGKKPACSCVNTNCPLADACEQSAQMGKPKKCDDGKKEGP